ncbi:uncharacterized protein [Argopecten irradians]|uniref:uncharacterized protein n=1 Tax=Argopecten irradians TaxID=31199 RepID=UPI00371CD1DE
MLFCLILSTLVLQSQASEDIENFRSERIRSKSGRFQKRGMPFGSSSGSSGGFGMGGSGGSGSPFHGMGGMSSGGAHMNGGPFGGGPMGMGGASSGPMRGPSAPGNPAMGGPGNKMFSVMGFQCIRHRVLCPEWCRVVDENGCQSCPCGPGGGMIAGGDMSAFGSISPFHNSPTSGPTEKDCSATKLCISMCAGSYSLGPEGPDGCQSCTCDNKNPSSSGSSGSSVGFTTSSTSVTGGAYMAMTSIGQQQQQQVVTEVVCPSTLTCTSTCSVGYTCGTDGCPTCECIHPSVVGIATQQVTIERPLYCPVSLSCQSYCQTGYQCGQDGCPTCQCVQSVQQIIQLGPTPEVTHQETIIVTGNTGTGCHDCAPQPEPIYITEPSTECQYNCDERPHYVIERPEPQPQYQTVVVQRPEVCHDCGTAQTQYVPLPQYVHPRPETQQITTQTHEVCHECGTTGYKPTYLPKPQTQPVYVQQPEVCHECETSGYQPIYVQRPVYTETSGTRPKPVYVTQSAAHTGHSGGGIMMGVLTGGMTSGSGGMHMGISGNSNGGYHLGTSSGGWTSGSSCPPLPPDCNPSCIKYDVAHCRLCLCESSVPSYGGSRYHG